MCIRDRTNCKAHTWVVVGSDPAEEGYILAYPIDDDTTDLYKTDKNDVDGNAKDGYHTYSFKYAGDADAVAGYQMCIRDRARAHRRENLPPRGAEVVAYG